MKLPDDAGFAEAADGRRSPAPTRAATVVLAVLAAAGAFTWLGPVLRPFLLAVFLFYVIQFAAKLLMRAGLGPRVSYAGVLVLAIAVATLFGQLVYRESLVFRAKWPGYRDLIVGFIERLPEPEALLPEFTTVRHPAPAAAPSPPPGTATTPATPEEPANRMLGEVFRDGSQRVVNYLFAHGLEVAEMAVLVLVYLLFLFVGGRKLPARLRAAFPDGRGDRLVRIGEGITESMERFMAVKTLVGLGMGATAGLVMLAAGLDHWLLWAFLFFASNYITYIGSMVACIPPIVLAFVDMPAGWALVMAAFLIANRLWWIDFVEIRMAGRELNLEPTLMFLWLSYWNWQWGVVGLLLGYPMLAAVKIALQHARDGEGWAVLLSDDH